MKSIPTTYRHVRFRSRLEADVAFLFDGLRLRWTYEPESFLLADGTHYRPDFWLPNLRLWVETRGYETAKGERQITGFSQKLRSEATEAQPAPDYLVLHTEACRFHDGTHGFLYDSNAVLRSCRQCNRWSFYGDGGSYRCRQCGAWDGDHDLVDLHDLTLVAGRLVLRDALWMARTVAEFVAEIKPPEAVA